MTGQEIYQRIRLTPNDRTFGPDAIEILAELAHKCQGKTVLEIGTAYGRSAFTWALATQGKVITYDIQDVQDIVMAFAKKFGIDNNVEARRGNSKELDWTQPVDIVWLDGGHDYETVKHELKTLAPHATKLICGHDYSHSAFPGVKQAVDEWGKVESKANIWFKFVV